MQNADERVEVTQHIRMREKLSRSLGNIALALVILGPMAFSIAYFLVKRSGSIYSARNWHSVGLYLPLALDLPVVASLLALISLCVKPNTKAAIIILASIAFDYFIVVYYVRITD